MEGTILPPIPGPDFAAVVVDRPTKFIKQRGRRDLCTFEPDSLGPRRDPSTFAVFKFSSARKIINRNVLRRTRRQHLDDARLACQRDRIRDTNAKPVKQNDLTVFF